MTARVVEAGLIFFVDVNGWTRSGRRGDTVEVNDRDLARFDRENIGGVGGDGTPTQPPKGGAARAVANVAHGSDPNVPRPDVLITFWRGSVYPNASTDADFWIRTV